MELNVPSLLILNKGASYASNNENNQVNFHIYLFCSNNRGTTIYDISDKFV